MGLAMIKTNQFRNGVPKKDFSDAFERLNNQARIMEQKLVMKVDNEIMNHYQSRQNEIRYMKDMIKRIKKLKKNTRENNLLYPFAFKQAKKLS